ncbi:hypothetical protein MMC31_007504, partial [Peltigera leucophlebia]|nr:hypothetical protein [Peltigera leucophlebia]
MVDFKKVNETLVEGLASQGSERAAAKDKAAGLLEMFYAERQKREDLEKQIEIHAADDLKLTAAAAPAEAVPMTEPSTAIIIQNDTPLSESSSLGVRKAKGPWGMKEDGVASLFPHQIVA